VLNIISTGKNQNSKIKVFAIALIISFFIFPNASFALSTLSYTAASKEEFSSLYFNENYTSIVVELPSLINQPAAWNNKFNSASSLGESILRIAEKYGGIVYVNNPEYAHSKILIHKGNYSKLVDDFKSLGFVVRNNTYGRPLLDYSKQAIGLPCFTISNPYNPIAGKNVRIGIVDTGIDDSHDDFPGTYDHSDLSRMDKIVYWSDTTYEEYNNPVDLNGHGTHVASIAAGTGAASNGKYSGVAPGANLMIWKASVGQRIDMDDLADAIHDAVDNNAQVISLSLGYGSGHASWCDGTTTDTDARAIYDAIRLARDNNIPVVISAGKDEMNAGSIEFPACVNLNNVIAVGSTLKKDYWPMWTEYNDPKELEINYIINAYYLNNSVIKINSGTFSGSRNVWSGFQYVFQSQTWPVGIEVKLEGQNRKRDCRSSEVIKWDPGGPAKGDAYWIWRKSFSSGSNILVEIFVKPNINEWFCLDVTGGWNHYYTNDNSHIYVNIAGTYSSSTKDLVHFESARGPSPQGIVKPFVTAPGVDICAARAKDTSVGEFTCGNDKYVSGTGTSAAAPFTAGLIALIKEVKPDASVDMIKNALMQADKKVVSTIPDNTEGYGRISAPKALKYLSKDVTCGTIPIPSFGGGWGGGGICGGACLE
jgi:subtilisin family serine protease